MSKIILIGAGVGGLTTAAILARAGMDVTVLEAHIYPGGCAGTFYHQGYRFDAGATLAGGFYPGGPMDIVARATGIENWPISPTPAGDPAPAMVVHLPEGDAVPRFGDARRHAEHRAAFGSAGERFFAWQEHTADALWDFALRNPAWPPQTLTETAHLMGHITRWLGADVRRLSPALLADAFRPVAAHLRGAPERLRQFVDGQLLISAQTTSERANALYGASALDLPRRGVVHLTGGIGAIADTLVRAVRANGGQVIFRQEVTEIVFERGKPVAVKTNKGQVFPADTIIANLPPWNLARLMGEQAPRVLKTLVGPPEGWGAFMVYVGVAEEAIPKGLALHHQVIEPGAQSGKLLSEYGEGRTVFLSLTPEGEKNRAPEGFRAVTMSTHTALEPWWTLYQHDRAGYDARKQAYLDRMLAAAERVIPHVRAAANLIMPGTPITFQRFTRREAGWVGGVPQTNLFRAWGPRLAPGVWMVGDSIFPGQSTAAVALGGVRVATTILGGEKRAETRY
ncbi:MAG: FAD-dependent oxidoreductase [Anaerolineales bacterium]|nr:FAD-dependent oxidoreductase [Anaerolineales bacterium]